MKLAICVVSPPGFIHSEAFREVAETLEAAARALGHDVVLTTRTDLPGRRTLVLGPNLLTRHPLPLAPGTILYNLEQAGQSTWFEPGVLDLFRRFPVWDYSQKNAEALVQMGVPRPRVVPIGWVPELRRITPAAEEIDVLFYGSLNARRRQVLEALQRAGARVEAVYGVYGAARDQLIARSRLVLNVHYYEAKVFEVVRVSYLLANGRAVVSERGALAEEEAPFEEGVAFSAYPQLVQTCLSLLQRPEERARLGEAGRRIMEARPETRFLGEALEAEERASAASAPAAQVQVPPMSEPTVAGRAVLAVACGSGAAAGALLGRGAREVVGLEASADAVTAARGRLTAVVRAGPGDRPELPYPPGYFDLLECGETLQQAPGAAELVRHLLRWLRPGGALVGSVPAGIAAPPELPGFAAPRPFADPWRGSRPTRLLLAPAPDDPADCWEPLLRALAAGPAAQPGVTLGVALPLALLAPPPRVAEEVAAQGKVDLLLTEAPRDPAAWERLLAGTTALVASRPAPELRALAARVGTPVLEGRTLLPPASTGPGG